MKTCWPARAFSVVLPAFLEAASGLLSWRSSGLFAGEVLLGLEAILVDLLDDLSDRSTESHTSADLQPLGVAIADSFADAFRPCIIF